MNDHMIIVLASSLRALIYLVPLLVVLLATSHRERRVLKVALTLFAANSFLSAGGVDRAVLNVTAMAPAVLLAWAVIAFTTRDHNA